jgi:hypothetical protein
MTSLGKQREWIELIERAEEALEGVDLGWEKTVSETSSERAMRKSRKWLDVARDALLRELGYEEAAALTKARSRARSQPSSTVPPDSASAPPSPPARTDECSPPSPPASSGNPSDPAQP